MKKFTLIIAIAFLVSPIKGFSQYENPGDTIGPFEIIDFETNSNFIGLDTSETNIWQVGLPQKLFFDSAYSSPNVIITDTLQFYPGNTHSYFDLYLCDLNYPGWYGFDMWLDFMHKYDTDTLKDGGFITVSYDKGETWINIIKDSCYFFDNCPPGESPNLYNENDSLFNGEFGFSGHSGGWVKTGLAWFWYPVYQTVELFSDTMILRFNFISDSIQTEKEGWMIDHIKLYAIDLGGGNDDLGHYDPLISLYPNPCTQYISITGVENLTGFKIFDQNGTKAMEGSVESARINVEELQDGIYILEFKIDKQIFTGKFIKQ